MYDSLAILRALAPDHLQNQTREFRAELWNQKNLIGLQKQVHRKLEAMIMIGDIRDQQHQRIDL